MVKSKSTSTRSTRSADGAQDASATAMTAGSRASEAASSDLDRERAVSVTAALEALAELVNSADALAKRAGRLELVGVWLSTRGISTTLDAAHVRLEDQCDSYLTVAWDFIDVARRQLAHWKVVLDGAEKALA